ncbi:hypothetical protein GCM10022252_14890 [Streptosporangium oxazolinicum]|uniref:Uncharacterized protein n=1 Tax=Streptosporangium oxazolinicum TaxID=909287 RepID=A0ABP8AJK8_9ACTN
MPYSQEMTGARSATRKKKITTTAETMPVRSRRKRSHISCPGERPTVSGVFAASASPVVVVAGAGMVIVRRLPTSMVSGIPGTIAKQTMTINGLVITHFFVV